MTTIDVNLGCNPRRRSSRYYCHHRLPIHISDRYRP
jgi:hypothetical protein